METVRKRIETNNESAVDIVTSQLKERVIGQDEAIDAIGMALDKARLRDDRRPVANLMFLGTTGVGKTELAKSLSDVLAVDKLHPAFLRIDCAQYANGHEVANLVGSPPGYVGREQKPALDKDLIEQMGSVVLFDEIEKGHPKLWNYLLQIMEGDGVKLLGTGETVNFNNATVIMTSNVGAREMQDMMTDSHIGFASPDLAKPQKMETVAMRSLKKQFAPEFINRLDAMVTFNTLSDEQLGEVIDAHVNRANLRYERMANIKLRIMDALKTELIAGADDRHEYGARPVLRRYEQMVESRLSKLVAQNAIGGNVIEADFEDDEVVFYQGEPLFGTPIGEILALDAGDYDEIAGDEPICETDEPKVVEFKPRPKKRRRR